MSPKKITLMNLSALLVVLSLSFAFCKKQVAIVEENPATLIQQPATALRIDTTGSAATISTVPNVQSGFFSGGGTATLGIDLDGDALFDLQIRHYLVAPSAGLLLGHSDFTLLSLNQNLKIAVDTFYQLQHFGTSTALTATAGLIAHRFLYGDTIKSATPWADSAIIYRHEENWPLGPSGPIVGVADGFYSLPQFNSTSTFVGFKLNNKFAWLRLSIKDRRNCILRQKALQN
jgi:hypothetical protein